MNWFTKLFSKPIDTIFLDPRIGSRFCKVDMRGCMASVRGEEKWGSVIAVGEGIRGLVNEFESLTQPRKVLNLSHRNRDNSYLLVRYDDGKEMWEPLWWCTNQNGYLEYQI